MRFIIKRINTPILIVVLFSFQFLPAQSEYDDDKSLALNYNTIIESGIMYGMFRQEDGPILITGDIVVPAGQVLEFSPGTVIHFSEGVGITVFGEIRAQGTVSEPIVFSSASPDPQPSDWDMIYCRSRTTSLFEHCEIRYSRRGVVVENGSLIINRTTFKSNEMHALSITNSVVDISESSIRNGHKIGILSQQGALLSANSIKLEDNETALFLMDYSQAFFNGGVIQNNSNGAIVSENAVFSLDETDVTKNSTGVIATAGRARDLRRLIYSNSNDYRRISQDNLLEMARSYDISSFQRAISIDIETFEPGITVETTRDQVTSGSFIGNITTGFSYYRPRSLKHPLGTRGVEYEYDFRSGMVIDSTVTYRDTVIYQSRYLGEQSDQLYAGLQPEIQIFASGKQRGVDVNLLIDMHGNQWLKPNNYLRKNLFNLSFDYGDYSLVVGDFYESGSETSISGRHMTGLRLKGGRGDMGRGIKRFEYNLSAGESEHSRDVGEHSLDIYNDVVDSGMSVRQQVTYVLSGSVRPVRNFLFSTRGIISRDQIDMPLFRTPISDPDAPEPVSAQSGSIEGRLWLMDGALEVFANIDLGNHDTVPDNQRDDIAWYKPEIRAAYSEVFSLLRTSDDFSSHFSFHSGVLAFVQGYRMGLSYMEISADYFSAGNPYLEPDKRILGYSIDKNFSENLAAAAEYQYERTMKSSNPLDRNIVRLRTTYQIEPHLPEFTVSYDMHLRNSKRTQRMSYTNDDDQVLFFDSTYTVADIGNLFSLEGRQSFDGGLSYSLRYQFLHDNDMTNYPDSSLLDLGDGVQHQVSGSLNYRHDNLFRNRLQVRVATRTVNRDSLQGISCRIGDWFTLTVLPGKLNLTLGAEYSWKRDRDYNHTLQKWNDFVYAKFLGGESVVRYTISHRMALSLKGRYEKSYDEFIGSGENYTMKMGGLHLTYLF